MRFVCTTEMPFCNVDSLREVRQEGVEVTDAQDLSRAPCDPVSRSPLGTTRSGSEDGSDPTGFWSGHEEPAGALSLVCARSGLRLARNAAFTAALLLFVALPQAASASLSWSGPILLDQPALVGVACPSTSQCTAVDGGGKQVTFDPTSPGTPTPTSVGVDGWGLDAVACPSTSQCTAGDGSDQEVTFDPTSPGTPIPTNLGLTGYAALTGVACPSTSQCTAVGGIGQEVTFDPATGSVTAGPTTIDGSNFLSGVACPSTSQCTAVDGDGHQVTFDPTLSGTPTPTTIDGTNSLSGVACPSTSQCTAVDDVRAAGDV